MRVTHVAPTSFGAEGLFGGGERYPLELCRALSELVDCRLVTFGPRGSVRREQGGLEIVVLKTVARLKGHPAHPVARGLAGTIGASDIIHTHHMRSAPSRVAALAGRARRRTVVVTDHGLGGGGWAGLLPRLFDAYLPVSRYSARTLGAQADRTHVIYGGADTERFAPGPDDDRRGALFVGRITPHKGVDRIIAALPDDLGLRVVGTAGHDPRPPESGYGRLLRRLARGKDVTFMGMVGDDELPGIYRSAQVFVLPSVNVTCYGRHVEIPELLGLSLIEAMASGTPVVCSDVGGLPEVVVDGETGFVVPPGDEDALRQRVEEVIRDPALARKMGRAARDHVLERFTWRACAERCVAAYELSATGAENPPNATGDSHTRTAS